MREVPPQAPPGDPPAQGGADRRGPRASASGPIQVAYFYKVRWGFEDEWLELFKRNHYPLLKAGVDAGVFLEVRAYAPRFHGDGRADWTLLVTITYRDWSALNQRGDPEEFERLFPDAERFRADEQRRFELLEAHWDVPLEERPLE